MKLEIRTAFAVALVMAVAAFANAQTPAQVGNVYVGTCDNNLPNNQQHEIAIYDNTGQPVTSFHGPNQNSCMTAMTFDVGDHFHVISARYGTQLWNVLEFDDLGNLLANLGPFNAPTGLTHDLQGNLYLAMGNIVKVDPAGNQTVFTAAGGAVSLDLGPDQRTMFYAAANGDIKSFDVVSGTQGPDIIVEALAKQVRALADNSILLDTRGAIQHWAPPPPTCIGCGYKQKLIYQIPANADSFSLDPDGVSFWTINTYYDFQNQLGKADVYRTDVKTGNPLASFSLQPLANGRFYSMSIGVNGDGMGSSAIVTPSIVFPTRTVGTTSTPKKAVLTNIGVVKVIVSSLAITGDFAIAKNGCEKGAPEGESCNISVTFTPTQVGTRTGSLKIFDNAGNSPQVVDLSGVGK